MRMSLSPTSSFGPLLRRWRGSRRLTQEQLAADAEVSVRHLSCLEAGKSRPSREMVLVLCSALELRLLSTLTTLGTPLDVTAQELVIESYFPADAESEAFLRGLA